MSPEEETVINRNTMKLQDHLYKALKQRDQYKAERDTLIDDIAVLKANISRLEKRVSELVHENVRLQNDLFTEELNQDEADFVIKKLRKQYTTLTDHIRLKASANPGEHRYIALVNFIDRLERTNDGR